MDKLKRYALALIMVVAMALSASPLAAWAATDADAGVKGDAPATEESGVAINKQATELKDDKTTVTLTIGSTEETQAADVVFVLDKSTSVDVRGQAKKMLDELNKHVTEMKAEDKDFTVNVGVVVFNRVAHNDFPLAELNDESYNTISNALNPNDEYTRIGGTNLEAGIRAGMDMLASDTSVPADNKHLVLVSDGVTYMWGTGDNPMSMYVDLDNTHAASVDYVNTYYKYRDHDWNAYKDAAQWMATAAENGIESYIEQFETQYTVGDSKDIEPYIPANEDHPYTSLEAAIYKAGKAWQDAASDGYHLYAFAPNDYCDGIEDELNHEYPWAPYFIGSLSTIGGSSQIYTDDASGVDGMFDGVKNSVIYEINSGTVTDTIGSSFDLDSLSSFKLTVGGTPYEGTVDDAAGTVSFDNGNYVITYHAGEGEFFTWDIKTPVEAAKPLQLSYDLKLVNKSEVPGEYTVPTNEGAKLEYTDGEGNEQSKDFPKPTVDYVVEAGEEEKPVQPEDNLGDLIVSKTVTGDLASTDDEFTFSVTVDGAGSKTYGSTQFTDDVATITLKGGQSIDIADLPEGASYTVKEVDGLDYELVSSENASGVIPATSITASFVNDKSTKGGAGTEEPDNPSTPENPNTQEKPSGQDGSDTTTTPEEPGNQGGSDTTVVPEEPSNQGGSNVTTTVGEQTGQGDNNTTTTSGTKVTPVQPASQPSQTIAKQTLPTTGDTSSIAAVAVAGIGIVCIAGAVLLRKRGEK